MSHRKSGRWIPVSNSVAFGISGRIEINQQGRNKENAQNGKDQLPTGIPSREKKPGQQRQHEDAQVLQIKQLMIRVVELDAEEFRYLHQRARQQREKHDHADVAAGFGPRVRITVHEKLSPEVLRIDLGILPRKRIRVTQSFDADEEGFVRSQSGLDQVLDLVAQMVLEFIEIGLG